MIPPVIVVDDSDAAQITYTGEWNLDTTGFLNNVDIFGPPFNSTVTGCHAAQCSLAFSFSGNSVSVEIAYDLVSLDTAPTAECFLDGIKFDPPPYTGTPLRTAIPSCSSASFPDGNHTLIVNITEAANSVYYLDYIQYTPSQSLLNESDGDLSLHTEGDTVVKVDNTDPNAAIVFDSGWGNFGNFANGTQKTGATLFYTFYGTYVAMFGYYAAEFGPTGNNASYSIDGTSPKTFTMLGKSAYNVMHFEIDNLSRGEHTVTVVNTGNGTGTPLILDYFVIHASATVSSSSTTTPTASSSPLSSSTSTSSSSSPVSSKASLNPAVIAGSVVGGSLLLTIAVLLFLFLRRRRRIQYDFIQSHLMPSAFYSNSSSLYPSSSDPMLSQTGQTQIPASKYYTARRSIQNSDNGLRTHGAPPLYSEN